MFDGSTGRGCSSFVVVLSRDVGNRFYILLLQLQLHTSYSLARRFAVYTPPPVLSSYIEFHIIRTTYNIVLYVRSTKPKRRLRPACMYTRMLRTVSPKKSTINRDDCDAELLRNARREKKKGSTHSQERGGRCTFSIVSCRTTNKLAYTDRRYTNKRNDSRRKKKTIFWKWTGQLIQSCRKMETK